jgi:hypothetical protein
MTQLGGLEAYLFICGWTENMSDSDVKQVDVSWKHILLEEKQIHCWVAWVDRHGLRVISAFEK